MGLVVLNDYVFEENGPAKVDKFSENVAKISWFDPKDSISDPNYYGRINKEFSITDLLFMDSCNSSATHLPLNEHK